MCNVYVGVELFYVGVMGDVCFVGGVVFIVGVIGLYGI